jgi:pteridine reductase
MESESLRGKRALVTGAGTRLGQAIAIALGAEGMRVAVHYHRHREGALSTVRKIEAAGGQGHIFAADLSSRDAARLLVDNAVEALNGLDLLVACAASFEAISLGAIDDEAWDRTFNLNLASPFAVAQRAVQELRRSSGNIVFITCSSVIAPFRGHIPYVTAKGGLYQLMRALALDLAPDVRVNAVAPGTVLPPEGMSDIQIERIVKHVPLLKVGSAVDVARAVIYLASSPFVTGEQVVVDGGRALARFPDAG